MKRFAETREAHGGRAKLPRHIEYNQVLERMFIREKNHLQNCPPRGREQIYLCLGSTSLGHTLYTVLLTSKVRGLFEPPASITTSFRRPKAGHTFQAL